MKLQIVNCFCSDEPDSGNPAAIVSEFSGDDRDKQGLAAKLNLPVTVFIFQPDSLQPTLEYFYPNSQMPLCLHGTIGAGKILFDLDRSAIKKLKTKSGLQLQVTSASDVVQVKVAAQSSPQIKWNSNEVETMLGIKKSDIATEFPYTTASVGSPKLLVPLRSPTLLAHLQPNFAQIAKWSEKHKINGLYVYACSKQRSSDFFSARGFNPRTGHNEDAATGVAAGALATCLKHNLVVEQGHFINKPCRIFATYNKSDDIWVGGKVIKPPVS